MNDVLAGLLGLKNTVPLALGRIGETMKAPAFAAFIAKKLDTHVMYKGDGQIKKVMVAEGSGFRR